LEKLLGKVAVITGAGSGIGAGVARACVDAGMSVAVVDVSQERATAVAKGLTTSGVAVVPFTVDVTDPEAVAALATDVFDQFGGCHLLHNNAGVCPFGRTWEHTTDEWRRVFDINVMGVVNGINAFVPRLIAQGEPSHIVNTASSAALRFVPATAVYNASKAAVVSISESLRYELASYGIGVSVLCPGGVATNIGANTSEVLGRSASPEQQAALMAELRTVDAAHVTTIPAETVGALVLEAVRDNAAYVITHPGSYDAVRARNATVENAYLAQHAHHAELP